MSAADPYGDYYYYGDNNNYTETYIHDYGLNQQTALQGGIGFCLFAGISLMLYLRLLFVRSLCVFDIKESIIIDNPLR